MLAADFRELRVADVGGHIDAGEFRGDRWLQLGDPDCFIRPSHFRVSGLDRDLVSVEVHRFSLSDDIFGRVSFALQQLRE